MAVALEFLGVFSGLCYIQCFLIFGFASFLFSFSVVKDFKNDIHRCNESAKSDQLQLNVVIKALNELGIRSMNLRQLSSFIISMINKSKQLNYDFYSMIFQTS